MKRHTFLGYPYLTDQVQSKSSRLLGMDGAQTSGGAGSVQRYLGPVKNSAFTGCFGTIPIPVNRMVFGCVL